MPLERIETYPVMCNENWIAIDDMYIPSYVLAVTEDGRAVWASDDDIEVTETDLLAAVDADIERIESELATLKKFREIASL